MRLDRSARTRAGAVHQLLHEPGPFLRPPVRLDTRRGAINPRFEEFVLGLRTCLAAVWQASEFARRLLAVARCPHAARAYDHADRRERTTIDFDQIAQADIVGVTGMSVQRFRMREILDELNERGAFVVVGGPWVTVKEDYFGDSADVIFVGEAEDTWSRFLSDWQRGTHRWRYEQVERTDMTRVPCPNYDLLRRNITCSAACSSRGCPFQCEFCDIIVTFGRRPRLKSSPQVIAELEALRANGMEMVFIVDDNLIGNKKAIAPVLQEVAKWQKANGYPFIFFTEASLRPSGRRRLTEANDGRGQHRQRFCRH